MAESNTRQANRAPVTLKIKFKSETLDQFIERYSVDISHGGIFIRTKDPLAVGTSLRFEFQLKDATPLIIGDGTVVWTREHDPKRAGISPGMGVRFDKLPPKSQDVLDKVLARKNGEPEVDASSGDEDDDDDDDGDFKETPTRVAPAALVDSLMNHSSQDDYGKRDPTPLPKPMPFHHDGGDFSDDAFDESTRVASLDSMLAHAESSAAQEETDESVISSSSRPPSRAMKATSPAPVVDEFGDLSDVDESGRSETRADSSTEDNARADETVDEGLDRQETTAQEHEDEETDDEGELDRQETTAHEDEEDEEDELAARRRDEDDDEEEGVTTSSSSTEVKPAKATVLEAPDTEEGGSSMRWIGVAVVILLIGGVGGFWLLSKDNDKGNAQKDQGTQAMAGATGVQAPVVAPVVNEDAIKDPIKDPIAPEEPPVALTQVVITTEPAGAMVSVDGTELSATSPATFDLAAGETFKVSVTHPEFLAQTMDIVADGSPIAIATLVPMPRVLRLSSEPAGAAITVNGKRLAAKTPLDMPLGTKLAQMPSLRVRMLLPGHKPLNASLATSGEFVLEKDKLVKTFVGSMVALPPRNRPPIKKPIVKDPDVSDTGSDTPPKDPVADTPKDPATDAPPPKDPVVKDPKVDPKANPKVDPKPDPKPDPLKPGQNEPTPDWMK